MIIKVKLIEVLILFLIISKEAEVKKTIFKTKTLEFCISCNFFDQSKSFMSQHFDIFRPSSDLQDMCRLLLYQFCKICCANFANKSLN